MNYTTVKYNLRLAFRANCEGVLCPHTLNEMKELECAGVVKLMPCPDDIPGAEYGFQFTAAGELILQMERLTEKNHLIYDKKGIPILPGDTLKMFHFIAAHRRERRYMYKFALEIVERNEQDQALKPPLLRISHLNLKGCARFGGRDESEYYWQLMDGRKLEQCEIVQGYGGVMSGQDYRDRPRMKTT